MHFQQTTPLMRRESSQISDSNPNFQLLFARTALTSYYKISFTKILFTIKFIHKNLKLKKVYIWLSIIIKTGTVTVQRGHFSFLFTATCLYVSLLHSFFLSPSLRFKITCSSNCHFSMLRAQSFFYLFFLNYFQFYLLERLLLLILIFFHY